MRYCDDLSDEPGACLAPGRWHCALVDALAGKFDAIPLGRLSTIPSSATASPRVFSVIEGGSPI
jgi:hypothetical protein